MIGTQKLVGQVSSRAYTKIKQNSYTAWPNEWGGLLVVKDNVVEDIIVMRHEATSVYFQIDDDELADFMVNLMENDPDKLKHIKGWVHCHPLIGWSGTDVATIHRLLPHFGDYCISIVDQFAKRLRFRIDYLDDEGIITHDDIPFDIVTGNETMEMVLPARKCIEVL